MLCCVMLGCVVVLCVDACWCMMLRGVVCGCLWLCDDVYCCVTMYVVVIFLWYFVSLCDGVCCFMVCFVVRGYVFVCAVCRFVLMCDVG